MNKNKFVSIQNFFDYFDVNYTYTILDKNEKWAAKKLALNSKYAAAA